MSTPSSETDLNIPATGHPKGAERIFELHFAQALSLDGREEVVLRLQHQRGVAGAWFDPDVPTRLLVRADPAYFSPLTLKDFVRRLWVGAKVLDQ